MKTSTLSFIIAFTAVSVAFATPDAPNSKESNTSYSVNISESKMEWIGKKVAGQHNGTLEIKTGELIVNNGKLRGGNFTIDMNTIRCLDITDAESNRNLVNHLKSDDFFSVATYPEAKLEITRVSPLPGQNKYNITGNLTIKGITEIINFPAVIRIDNNRLSATADFDVDRSKYNVRYGSGSFFDNLGDKMIHDNFNIKINLVASLTSE